MYFVAFRFQEEAQYSGTVFPLDVCVRFVCESLEYLLKSFTNDIVVLIR